MFWIRLAAIAVIVIIASGDVQADSTDPATDKSDVPSPNYAWVIEINQKLSELHAQGNYIRTAVQREKKRTFRLQNLLIVSLLLNFITIGLVIYVLRRNARFRGSEASEENSSIGGTIESGMMQAMDKVRDFNDVSGKESIQRTIIGQAIAVAILMVGVLIFFFLN